MINAHLGLTYACNMNCKHCYVKEKEKKGIRFNQEVLLNRLQELGTFYITYTMGETLLWPDFPRFAIDAKERGFYQILLSNGSTIQSRNTVDSLKQYGINKVGVSIDSSIASVHDENRRFPGAYQKACYALELLLKEPKILTQVAMTISSNNISEVPFVLQQLKEIGVNSFSFLWLRHNGEIAPIENAAEYQRIMRFLIQERDKNGININVHDFRVNKILHDMYNSGEIGLSTMTDMENMNSCHAFYELVLIDPSGDMYECNFAKQAFANIYDTSIEEIAKHGINQMPLCGGCNKCNITRTID